VDAVVTHRLPEHSGEGDIGWFGRRTSFERQETRRQVEYKRRRWPGLGHGPWSKNRRHLYPHILPAGHQEKAFFDPSDLVAQHQKQTTY